MYFVCKCVYICIYVHASICIHTRTHICSFFSVSLFLSEFNTWENVFDSTDRFWEGLCGSMFAFVGVCVKTGSLCVCVCMCVCVCVCVYVCVYMRTWS